LRFIPDQVNVGNVVSAYGYVIDLVSGRGGRDRWFGCTMQSKYA
jgi:hypothetical protein